MKTTLKQRTYATYQDLHFAARAYGLKDKLIETTTEFFFMKDGVKCVWVKTVTPPQPNE